MLVKLDQNAAEALQSPDKLLKGNKILDRALDSISNHNIESLSDKNSFARQYDRRELYSNVPVQSETLTDNTLHSISDSEKDSNTDPHQLNKLEDPVHNYLDPTSSHNFTTELASSTSDSQKLNIDEKQVGDNSANTMQSSSDSSHLFEQSRALPSRKFTIQSSKSRSRNFTLEKRVDRKFGLSEKRINRVHPSELGSNLATSSQGADDIRASINRSLQEYTLQTPLKTLESELSPTEMFEQNPNYLHFDSQPNLVQHIPLLDNDQVDDLKSNQLSLSPSLSIDVPDDRSHIVSSRNDIASRLIQQSALKKKSTFYLHKVINRLAHPNSQRSAILSDQMKIRLRRAQMRAASYGRRLNYYFRTYPNLKYIVLIYLVLMQMLIIYVLIFYQSSSSSNDLSTQIKQQEMVGSRYE